MGPRRGAWGAQAGALAAVIPFAAVSGASVLNLLMTRASELQTGLEVFTPGQRISLAYCPH
eukprot:1182541-Prorocentrum_minimum.AAC.6